MSQAKGAKRKMFGAKTVVENELSRGDPRSNETAIVNPDPRVGGGITMKNVALSPVLWLCLAFFTIALSALFAWSSPALYYFVAATIPISGWLLLRAEWMKIERKPRAPR